jgi:hypothetical protein
MIPISDFIKIGIYTYRLMVRYLMLTMFEDLTRRVYDRGRQEVVLSYE